MRPTASTRKTADQNKKGEASREMAKLVLLRHGQSLFNEEGRFTGWMDCRPL